MIGCETSQYCMTYKKIKYIKNIETFISFFGTLVIHLQKMWNFAPLNCFAILEEMAMYFLLSIFLFPLRLLSILCLCLLSILFSYNSFSVLLEFFPEFINLFNL